MEICRTISPTKKKTFKILGFTLIYYYTFKLFVLCSLYHSDYIKSALKFTIRDQVTKNIVNKSPEITFNIT